MGGTLPAASTFWECIQVKYLLPADVDLGMPLASLLEEGDATIV